MPEEAKIVPKIEPPDIDIIDDAADRESAAFAAGDDLRRVAQGNKHRRGEDIKEHMHEASKTLLWSAVIGLAVLGFCFIWHLVTPTTWNFLDSEQIDDIRNILFSGLLAGVLSNYFKQYL